MSENGKGDTPRFAYSEKGRENFDRIFKKPMTEERIQNMRKYWEEHSRLQNEWGEALNEFKAWKKSLKWKK